MNVDQKINFEVSLNEANVIIQALGKMPYETVYILLEKLQRQAQEQLNTADKS